MLNWERKEQGLITAARLRGERRVEEIFLAQETLYTFYYFAAGAFGNRALKAGGTSLVCQFPGDLLHS